MTDLAAAVARRTAMGGRKKAKRSRHVEPAIDRGAARVSSTEDVHLVELLEAVGRQVDEALEVVGTDHRSVRSPAQGEPGAPRPGPDGARTSRSDQLLADRYESLLFRSGVVGNTVHHLPSRLRERMEEALRELTVGVARDRPATGAQVDVLVQELVGLIGERIVSRVEDWHEPGD